MSARILYPILLQLAGVIVVIAEIIIPSGGILAILALSLFGYSIYMVFGQISTQAGFILLALDIILLPVLVVSGLKLLARSPVTLKKTLSSKEGVSSQSPELEKYAGQEGTALTDLRPSGTALIHGKRIDVVTRGEYITRNSRIIVSSVSGNQIIVSEIE